VGCIDSLFFQNRPIYTIKLNGFSNFDNVTLEDVLKGTDESLFKPIIVSFESDVRAKMLSIEEEFS